MATPWGWIVPIGVLVAAMPAPAQRAVAPPTRRQLSAEAEAAYSALDFAKALTLFHRDLAACEAAPRFPDDCLDLMNVTATQYYAMGGSARDGEALARRALALALARLGESDPDTAASYDAVGINLYGQTRYGEAEPFYRKALDIRVAKLGERHAETAMIYNHLAANLNAQGRYAEAEPLYRTALDIRVATLGERDTDTARSFNNLAANLYRQGRYAEAETMFRKTLEIRQAVLGERHPHTAESYSNLASTLDSQGRYAETEPLYRKALAIHVAILGDSHPDTATFYSNVGVNLFDQGRYAEAEPLYRKALDIRAAALDPLHRDLLSSRGALALLAMRHLNDPGTALVQLRLAAAAIAERTRNAGRDKAAADEAESYRGYSRWQVEAGWRLAHASGRE